ncbi:hypothetical protein D8Y22_21935 [Salinadaptatus halalkaliphilus]|uniref:DUF7847 domain-containing protein n=1 Tax=Salinadaptatus halalkaliphilus TaxID=2419781 RepID=A0A4S3TFT1_9EURY|nr:hypothetical protein [Salinadaptatus halalkaliphilus]THE62731.1 hypothetical protein D8Y22_21935 [Salinadaptatus halalkaliphilus]
MAVIRSLKRTPSLLLEHPIVFVPVLLYGIVQLALQVPQLYAQSIDPFLSIGLSLALGVVSIFVFPFFQGGLLGMANDAATGDRTSIARFFAHGKTNYVSLLGAYLLVFAIGVTVSIAVMFGIFAGAIGFIASEGSLAVIAGIALVGFAFVVLYIVVVTAIHFYGHAIVIENARAIEGFKRSVALVRSNLYQIGGYVGLMLVGGAIVTGISVAVMLVAFPTTPTDPTATPDLGPVLLGYGGSTLLTSVFGTVYLIFSVVFYRAIARLDARDTAATPL